MAEYSVTLADMLKSLLEEKKYTALKDVLKTMNPADVAIAFEEIDDERVPLMFRLLPKDMAAETFAEMDSDIQELLIKGFSDYELREVVDELCVDDAADLIEEMPANVVKRVLAQVEPDFRKEINDILRYPEDSAGSVMTTEYITLHQDMTVEESIAKIRRIALDKETIYTLYVTDRRKLVGLLSLKDLILVSNSSTTIGEVMDTNVISVNTHDDSEEVAQKLKRYNFLAIPVVDNENRMVGIITFDDAMDVIEEEATEDIELMAGMTPSGSKSYLKTSPVELFKQRIPWLLLLMISATFTSMIINHFEAALAAQAALTAFIPMLMGTGGNSGSQSSVTIIRSLSLDEVEFEDLPLVIWKEVRTAVLCGGVLAVACFFKILLIDRMLLHNPNITVVIAFVVALSLAITILVAKVIGCVLPMVAKKLGFDPAVMASPLIQTAVDALSLMIFFNVVSAVLF